jgi:alkylhydroperoxidase family enzyme
VSTPRLVPVDDPSPEAAEALAKTPQRDGRALNLFRMFAHNPRLLRRVNALGGAFAVHSSVPQRERELVILRTAGRLACGYEIQQHRTIAATIDIDAALVDAVVAGADVDGLTDGEAALVAMADQLIDRGDVDDATWSALAARWTDAELVELVTMAGFYRMLATVIATTGVPLEPRNDTG